MTAERRRGRQPVYKTEEERIAAKKARDAASHQRRMANPEYRAARVAAQRAYRAQNPDKAEEQKALNTELRRKRRETDEEYAERVRRRAREATAARKAKIESGAPDGWKIIVRYRDEVRGRAITKVRFEEDSTVPRAIARVKTRSDKPQSWATREEAEAFAQLLREHFPNRIDQARVDVA